MLLAQQLLRPIKQMFDGRAGRACDDQPATSDHNQNQNQPTPPIGPHIAAAAGPKLPCKQQNPTLIQMTNKSLVDLVAWKPMRHGTMFHNDAPTTLTTANISHKPMDHLLFFHPHPLVFSRILARKLTMELIKLHFVRSTNAKEAQQLRTHPQMHWSIHLCANSMGVCLETTRISAAPKPLVGALVLTSTTNGKLAMREAMRRELQMLSLV